MTFRKRSDLSSVDRSQTSSFDDVDSDNFHLFPGDSIRERLHTDADGMLSEAVASNLFKKYCTDETSDDTEDTHPQGVQFKTNVTPSRSSASLGNWFVPSPNESDCDDHALDNMGNSSKPVGTHSAVAGQKNRGKAKEYRKTCFGRLGSGGFCFRIVSIGIVVMLILAVMYWNRSRLFKNGHLFPESTISTVENRAKVIAELQQDLRTSVHEGHTGRHSAKLPPADAVDVGQHGRVIEQDFRLSGQTKKDIDGRDVTNVEELEGDFETMKKDPVNGSTEGGIRTDVESSFRIQKKRDRTKKDVDPDSTNNLRKRNSVGYQRDTIKLNEEKIAAEESRHDELVLANEAGLVPFEDAHYQSNAGHDESSSVPLTSHQSKRRGIRGGNNEDSKVSSPSSMLEEAEVDDRMDLVDDRVISSSISPHSTTDSLRSRGVRGSTSILEDGDGQNQNRKTGRVNPKDILPDWIPMSFLQIFDRTIKHSVPLPQHHNPGIETTQPLSSLVERIPGIVAPTASQQPPLFDLSKSIPVQQSANLRGTGNAPVATTPSIIPIENASESSPPEVAEKDPQASVVRTAPVITTVLKNSELDSPQREQEQEQRGIAIRSSGHIRGSLDGSSPPPPANYSPFTTTLGPFATSFFVIIGIIALGYGIFIMWCDKPSLYELESDASDEEQYLRREIVRRARIRRSEERAAEERSWEDVRYDTFFPEDGDEIAGEGPRSITSSVEVEDEEGLKIKRDSGPRIGAPDPSTNGETEKKEKTEKASSSPIKEKKRNSATRSVTTSTTASSTASSSKSSPIRRSSNTSTQSLHRKRITNIDRKNVATVKKKETSDVSSSSEMNICTHSEQEVLAPVLEVCEDKFEDLEKSNNLEASTSDEEQILSEVSSIDSEVENMDNIQYQTSHTSNATSSRSSADNYRQYSNRDNRQGGRSTSSISKKKKNSREQNLAGTENGFQNLREGMKKGIRNQGNIDNRKILDDLTTLKIDDRKDDNSCTPEGSQGSRTKEVSGLVVENDIEEAENDREEHEPAHRRKKNYISNVTSSVSSSSTTQQLQQNDSSSSTLKEGDTVRFIDEEKNVEKFTADPLIQRHIRTYLHTGRKSAQPLENVNGQRPSIISKNIYLSATDEDRYQQHRSTLEKRLSEQSASCVENSGELFQVAGEVGGTSISPDSFETVTRTTLNIMPSVIERTDVVPEIDVGGQSSSSEMQAPSFSSEVLTEIIHHDCVSATTTLDSGKTSSSNSSTEQTIGDNQSSIIIQNDLIALSNLYPPATAFSHHRKKNSKDLGAPKLIPEQFAIGTASNSIEQFVDAPSIGPSPTDSVVFRAYQNSKSISPGGDHISWGSNSISPKRRNSSITYTRNGIGGVIQEMESSIASLSASSSSFIKVGQEDHGKDILENSFLSEKTIFSQQHHLLRSLPGRNGTETRSLDEILPRTKEEKLSSSPSRLENAPSELVGERQSKKSMTGVDDKSAHSSKEMISTIVKQEKQETMKKRSKQGRFNLSNSDDLPDVVMVQTALNFAPGEKKGRSSNIIPRH